MATGKDTLKTRKSLRVGAHSYDYFSIPALAGKLGGEGPERLPFSLKVILENLLRFEDGRTVTTSDIEAVVGWLKNKRSDAEISFRPARVLMQDFTGVPAVADLAAMRDAMIEMGGDPEKINPLSPVDLVIDHSVSVDNFGSASAFGANVALEMKRNHERYEFLRWGQTAFDNFRVVPPGTGICHQVNIEYLAQTVWTAEEDGVTLAYPDTLVGTDSHTTMVNCLAVLGWGVGGIEAEAVMLGQPISMLVPEVVGFRLDGRLPDGATATDLVLTITQMLRAHGVVGKFVEFFGPGLNDLALPDRATIANMAPEYGATCGFFPIDQKTIDYLDFTNRSDDRVRLVETYAKAQGMWRDQDTPDPEFSSTMELDLGAVVPSIAGPKRPQDRIDLSDAAGRFIDVLPEFGKTEDELCGFEVKGEDFDITNGDIVIAAITSCTNTSNPSVMIGAGLVARNAVAKGLGVKPWVKTSLAPGSKVVTDYLKKSELDDDLDALGFNLVGYGCTTCIGNSGPLPQPISDTISENDLVCCSVLSGNRNFEGRISPDVRANYLASPPLVVAYAIAGTMLIDFLNDPIGEDEAGTPVYFRDIWPSNAEVQEALQSAVEKDQFRTEYADVFSGTKEWQAIETAVGTTYGWKDASTYVRRPSFFDNMGTEPEALQDVKGARILELLGDSVTTDHISPAGTIARDGPAAAYLNAHQVRAEDFNSYGSRRGNHEVMMRGTFANIRIRNEVAPGTEGGWSKHYPDGEVMSAFDAAMKYEAEGVPLVAIAGKEFGTGSSRDWAAKGARLLGIRAVIAESYERIYRSNLVCMGILPLSFKEGETRKSLGLIGDEIIDVTGVVEGVTPRMTVDVKITRANGEVVETECLCRIDTEDEVAYYTHGGILQYVLRNLLKAA